MAKEEKELVLGHGICLFLFLQVDAEIQVWKGVGMRGDPCVCKGVSKIILTN